MTSEPSVLQDQSVSRVDAAAQSSGKAPAFDFEPHNCFACGELNEHGLRLQLHLEPGRSWTEVVIDKRFEGWVGVAHGGILATILDEVMAWSLVASDNWGVTARMSVEFKRPARVATTVRGEGWIVRVRRRLVETGGRVTDVDGNVLAEAEATYLIVDEDTKRELQARYGYRVRSVRALAESAMPQDVAGRNGAGVVDEAGR